MFEISEHGRVARFFQKLWWEPLQKFFDYCSGNYRSSQVPDEKIAAVSSAPKHVVVKTGNAELDFVARALATKGIFGVSSVSIFSGSVFCGAPSVFFSGECQLADGSKLSFQGKFNGESNNFWDIKIEQV